MAQNAKLCTYIEEPRQIKIWGLSRLWICCYLSFEVLAAVSKTIKIAVFYDVTPCIMVHMCHRSVEHAYNLQWLHFRRKHKVPPAADTHLPDYTASRRSRHYCLAVEGKHCICQVVQYRVSDGRFPTFRKIVLCLYPRSVPVKVRYSFLTSSFRRALNVIFFLLGVSPASEC
jgi:hypothetical protein